jgi:hypothetical protein
MINMINTKETEDLNEEGGVDGVAEASGVVGEDAGDEVEGGTVVTDHEIPAGLSAAVADLQTLVGVEKGHGRDKIILGPDY